MITTAIGPKILPIIAPLIAEGIKERYRENNTNMLDVIACENMIGGSQFLKEKVYDSMDDITKKFADKYIGFPNAAVDRIVPLQSHEDPLLVTVEDFKEWVVDESQMKNTSLKLDSVHYAPDLEPYIERKLFSVNTGHATVAYTGNVLGYETIDEAIADPRVLERLVNVQSEIRELLLAKFDFTEDELVKYHEQIIKRFENKFISDDITRVGRTPIRKLGYNERFIRPIRELALRGLDYSSLLEVVGDIFKFDHTSDEESQRLMEMLQKESLNSVVTDVTGLNIEVGLAKKICRQVELVH